MDSNKDKVLGTRYVVSNRDPYEAFKSRFDGSIPSVKAVANYLERKGHKLEVHGLQMRDPGDKEDSGDIWVLKDDGTRDYRIEVRQLTKEDFTCADDFRHPIMTFYFVLDWVKLKPKPKFVFIVNKTCTYAAKITCGATVANWLVTNAPRYSSYAVQKDLPEYIAL